MGRRARLAAALPAAVAVLGLATVPAVAAPAEPAAPQAEPAAGQPLGKAIGNAGTLLGAIRALPGVDASTPPLPIPGLPNLGGSGNGLLSLGFGLSSAKTNSEADNPKSAAEAAPFGASLFGTAPAVPGSVSQTAPPDHESPATGGFDIPENPLIGGDLLKTSAHARYSDTLGPCVDPIGRATSSVANLDLLKVLPGLPDLSELTKSKNPVEQVTSLTKLLDKGSLGMNAKQTRKMAGPMAAALDMAGGVPGLPGLPQIPGLPGLPGLPGGEGGNAVVSLPGTLSTDSSVRLVPMKDSKNKSVQSTSTLRAASLQLLKGTPFNLEVDVASDPTLKVTSTGEKAGSTIEYTTPLLRVKRGGDLIAELDAQNPEFELPISLLPIGEGEGLLNPEMAAELLQRIPGLGAFLGDPGNTGEGLSAIPVIGDLQDILPANSFPGLGDLSELNLGVIKLSVAKKQDVSAEKVKGQDEAPFTGYELGSTARLLNLEVLPSNALNEGLLPDLPELPGVGDGPLAQVVLGEQVAKAYAPKGGVVCGQDKPEPPTDEKEPKGQASPPPPLADTNAAYDTVPLLWTGGGLVLAGAALVGFRPLRERLTAVRDRRE